MATDGAWRAETTVGISVQDVNDNRPEFDTTAPEYSADDSTYLFMVPASTGSFALIGRVTATDKDDSGPNSQVRFQSKE